MMWWSLANRFNFMSHCVREKLRRFGVSEFSKVARLNVTHCSTGGVLALAFASWRAGVILAHTLPEHALLHLKAQQQPLLIPDSQHGPLSHSLLHGLEMLVACSWSESALSTWIFSFPFCTFPPLSLLL